MLNVGDTLGQAHPFLPILNVSSNLYYHDSILKSQRMSMTDSKREEYLKRVRMARAQLYGAYLT